jgi:2-haloacid dehalogenase
MAKWWFASEVARKRAKFVAERYEDHFGFRPIWHLGRPFWYGHTSLKATEFADCWREKQLEYSFRRGLMHNYADFSICTSDALNFTCQRFKAAISPARRRELLGLYQYLPRFDDVTPALLSLRAAFRVFAFSNGKRSEIDAVLSNANILDYFEGIVTADDVRSFKPDPAVYSYARRATRAWSSPFWLVSSNPWDVIGARSAGLSSAWVQRSEEKIYDPWGVEPDVTVRSLTDLPAALEDDLSHT